mmetsp:Transcript_128912/g.223598  ORF Transcript_128912/g.223598 Transcript_128912/m.223598 type:complete len:91 (-) Transcript_128912:835-1107(-)
MERPFAKPRVLATHHNIEHNSKANCRNQRESMAKKKPRNNEKVFWATVCNATSATKDCTEGGGSDGSAGGMPRGSQHPPFQHLSTKNKRE